MFVVLAFLVALISTPLAAQPGVSWWSLRQLKPPTAPGGSGPPSVDAFVRDGLRTAGLTPSSPADRRTLIRRATFDLHGLPPTPEETTAFLNDHEPLAFERLVDRLLESPRYGERWARHWLDVAHYGDTHGYDKDKVRPNAWPYRDWVIRALNADMPYQKFVRMQIAGDVLQEDDPDGVIATGFIAAGPWDYVGHVELREGTVDKKITRDLDRDDMITTTMSAFTSLTVHCARCHDHKFDPISQNAYFGLQSVFAGVERADRTYDDATTARKRRNLEGRRRLLADKLSSLTSSAFVTPEMISLREKLSLATKKANDAGPAQPPTSPSNGWHSHIMDGRDHEKWVEVDLGRAQDLEHIVLWPARPTDFKDTPGFGFPQRYTVAVCETADFSRPRVLIADARRRDDRPRAGDQPLRIESDGRPIRVIRVTGHRLWKRYKDWVMALAELEAIQNGRNTALHSTVRAKDSIEAGRWSRRHLVDGFTSRDPIGHEREGVLRQRALEIEVQRVEWRLETATRDAERDAAPDVVATRERTRGALDEVERTLAGLPPQRLVYAAAPFFKGEGNFKPAPDRRPRPVHVLERGEVTRPLKPATPRGLDAIAGLPGSFAGDLRTDAARRAGLARWLTHADNPLIWRSIVNRVWHHHFGRGIVASPNDFGKMGAPPSHPELLEWLAIRLRDRGGSLKDLHRLILTSATWRQSSSNVAKAAARDASNVWLWRAPRRRLEAEAVRDTVLHVAGTLDLTMGGPGFRTFGFKDDHSPHYLYEQNDPSDQRTWRRAVYRFQVRSVPDPFMETMDCPDPSRSVAARPETMTPLQALALLNDGFMLEQARQFARRLEREAPTAKSRIARAFQLALGRAPTDEEHASTLAYAEQHGLPALCRLIFNLNEFLFVD